MQKTAKKVLLTLCAALMVVVFALTMAGCDKSGSIKKAFEKEGYTVTTVDANNDTAKGIFKAVGMTDDQIKKAGEYELILCVNGLINSALVLKCSSSGEVKDFLTSEDKDGNKDTSAYDKAKENGLINGNCYIITVSSSAKEIFKNA